MYKLKLKATILILLENESREPGHKKKFTISRKLFPTGMGSKAAMKKHNYESFVSVNTYRLRTACIDMYSAGTLNVSKNISAIFSLNDK